MRKEIYEERTGERVGFAWKLESKYGFDSCEPALETFIEQTAPCPMKIYEEGFPSGSGFIVEGQHMETKDRDYDNRAEKFTNIVLMLLKVSDVSGEMRCDLIRAAAKSLGLL